MKKVLFFIVILFPVLVTAQSWQWLTGGGGDGSSGWSGNDEFVPIPVCGIGGGGAFRDCLRTCPCTQRCGRTGRQQQGFRHARRCPGRSHTRRSRPWLDHDRGRTRAGARDPQIARSCSHRRRHF